MKNYSKNIFQAHQAALVASKVLYRSIDATVCEIISSKPGREEILDDWNHLMSYLYVSKDPHVDTQIRMSGEE